jgi:putative transposase
MPGTYSKIYIQCVFAVKRRENLLQKPWRDEVFKYISGIITEKKQKSIIVNGVSDHIHIFFGLNPAMGISDLVRDIKNNSSKFINEQNFLNCKFAWQEGYGAFSYSPSHVDRVYKYIANQEEHHRNKTFKHEYVEFLNKYEIEHDEKYLFDWFL